MRTGAGFFSPDSTLIRLASSTLLLTAVLLCNAGAYAGSSPFIPHSDRLAETAILDNADLRLTFPEAQALRQDFKKFHGLIDVRRHGDHFWVYVRWSPSPEPMLLQIRHGSRADIRVFQSGFPNGCPTTEPVPHDQPIDSFSDWRDFPLCPGTNEVYVQFYPHAGYPRVNFRVVSPENATALNFIETASIFSAGGLGVIACLLAGFRIISRGWDPLAIGFLVEQLSRLTFWVVTLAPPPFTSIAKLKIAAAVLPMEFLRLAVPVGYFVFMVLLFLSGKRRSWWHRALAALTGAGVVALFSALFSPTTDYTEIIWGLLFISLPLSLVVALGSASRSVPLPGQAFERMSLNDANWGIVGVILVAWLSTVGTLAELTADAAILFAMAFYLVVGASVLVEAAKDSRQALTAALTERLAREQADREAQLQSRQHAETRDLLLMLTHELRTPLGVLRFSLDAVPTMPSARARAEEAIRNMDSLVERCLQAAHLETDAIAEMPDRWNAALEIPLLVGQCSAPERVQLAMDPATPATLTRRSILALIISVLIDNALKYGASRLPVLLRVAPAAQNGVLGLAIWVDNQPGPSGLPDPKRLFQKYYRSAAAHQHTGAGLGLFLSSRLTATLGGQLTYEPSPELTRFKLWIPC